MSTDGAGLTDEIRVELRSGVADYGGAVVQVVDGRARVVSADATIIIAAEALALADDVRLPVDGDGCLRLAGDANYRYRPLRFDAHRGVICVLVP